MKSKNILFAMLIASTTFFMSCEKDDGKLPTISFKTGSGYTSANATATQGQTITIGINAAKAEKKDVLKTFDASKSLDGGTDVSFSNEALTGASGDAYSKDLTITTRTQAGTEKYTFTVINRDGLKNSVSLTLTVQ